MTTYTTIDSTGEAMERGLTAIQAMEAMLYYDGHDYEIRREKGGLGWRLYHSERSGGMTRTVIYSLERDQALAIDEIAQKVIHAGWPRMPEAMSDESYDAMMAELAAQNAA